MTQRPKGIVVMPTGSGKTIVQVADAKRHLYHNRTVVVVAPRILLAQQLCCDYLDFISDANVLHVHSGHTMHDSETHPDGILRWWCVTPGAHLIFTTYHSLHRIVESDITVDAVYFDEAHYAIRGGFFDAVKSISAKAQHAYYFTATPKYSACDKPGMNDTDVFGDIVYECPASDMIEGGYIVPPRLITTQPDTVVDGKYNKDIDVQVLLDTITDNNLNTTLVCCKNTTQLFYITHSQRFQQYCKDNGYTIYDTSSKYGSRVAGERVGDSRFFASLRQASKTGRKFILLHVSRISEGISLHGLESVILLKKMSTSTLTQTIGRALRLQDGKTEGKVLLPCYSKYLQRTQKFTQQLVQRVYTDGATPTETIKR